MKTDLGQSLFFSATLAVLATAAAGVHAQSVTNPSWTHSPDENLSADLLPDFANAIGVSGVVTVHCLIVEDGHPFRCEVVDETVHGLGFGSAARLVVASGELRTSRINGQPVPGEIQTRVRFRSPALDSRGKTWTGREATAEALRLASQVLDKNPQPPINADQMMDGLDYDRRAVVRPWIEELMTPSPARQREIRTIQLARLFSVEQLQDALAGRYPEVPNERAFLDACPEMTASEVANVKELRRRYCDRYGCGPEA